MSVVTINTEADTAGIKDLIKAQRNYFSTGVTKDIAFRKQQMNKLKKLIEENEDRIVEALHKDLRKHEFEAYATEVGFVLVDLKKAISNVGKWAKPRKVGTPLFQFKAKSYVKPDPYGVTLVIAPWNYPFQLLFAPVVGAMSAGNTVVLKPSELAPHTSKLAAELINNNFDPEYMVVVEGGIPESQALLAERFDYIFFTGGTAVGKIVYQAAAKHLTPVTLELGGKSPCIIDKDTHLKYTAKRIVWGKFVNAGQTCIAPDYILVDRKIKDKVIEKFKHYIKSFYGDDPQQSEYLPRIINERHFDRLKSYLSEGNIISGGRTDRDDLYIEPTLIDGMSLDSPIMQEEIFGPILPIIAYDKLSDAINMINGKSKPLALYMFSKNNKKINRVLEETTAGGACINDTLMHIANPELPFGGVGDSGIGAYHGESSFELFSHLKSVLHRSFLIDDPVRYAPYKLGRGTIKKIMDWTL
ncbi:MAG: aldehyde dehydrogenase [Saprospiraceae bacterium]|nr:aldehyde dehydrogenase [Saprospiraceae bacterium]